MKLTVKTTTVMGMIWIPADPPCSCLSVFWSASLSKKLKKTVNTYSNYHNQPPEWFWKDEGEDTGQEKNKK